MSDKYRNLLDQLAGFTKGPTGLQTKKDSYLDTLHQQALDVLSDERHKHHHRWAQETVREIVAEKERRKKIRKL